MARKRKSFRKNAYRMTPRRKAALRKAQLISARKRKKNNLKKATVGVLAAGTAVGLAYGGHKWGGNVADIASGLRNRSFRWANASNSPSGKITVDNKVDNITRNAVSPPTAAQQRGAPQTPPNLNRSATSSRPNSGVGFGTVQPRVPGQGKPAKAVTNLPQAESIIDPQKPARPVYPAEHMPSMERILSKLGKKQEAVNQDDLYALSKIWADYKLSHGVRIKGFNNQRAIYTTMLDMFSLETKGEIRERQKKARSQQQ